MKWICVFLLMFCVTRAQSVAECDSLIASGIRQMQKGEHARSLEMLTRAASVSQERGWHKQHFLALNNIGANYYNMLDYGEALRHYLDAYTLSIKSLGPKQEMTALNNIGILYLSDREYAKAREYMLKAYDLATQTDNAKKTALYAVNLALVCNAQSDLAKAREFLDTAFKFASENPNVLPEARIALADNHYRSGKYAEARELALQNLSAGENPKHRHETLLTLSRIAQKQDNLDQAQRYAQSALEIDIDEQSRIGTFEQLALIHTQSKQFDRALAAKDSVLKLTEAFNRIRNGRVYENNRVKFELENYKSELGRNRAQLESSNNRLYQFFGGGLFLLLVIGWAARTKHISERQKKTILARDNQLLEKQMREQETQSMLEQERLRNEVEARNRKLSAKALYLVERDELIASLLADLSTVRQLRDEPLIDKQIAKLKSLLKPEGEWEDFVSHFDQANHGMLSMLRKKHPVLTSGDLRYISYVYMNLSHKEIASLLNITPEACRKRKERVCKKLGIEESGSLTGYLSSLR